MEQRATAQREFVFVTGHNAVGKSTLAENAVKVLNDLISGGSDPVSPGGRAEWHCIDGDEFVEANPELRALMRSTSTTKVGEDTAIMDLMRGEVNLGPPQSEEARYNLVKQHDGVVRQTWEPFFRKVFDTLLEKMCAENLTRVIFPYHAWRSWTLDLVREIFSPFFKCKIMEVTTKRELRLQRWLGRQVERGLDPEQRWHGGAAGDGTAGPMQALKEEFGSEYKEEHFLRFVEQRYFVAREPIPEPLDTFFIDNDEFDGARVFVEKVLGLKV